MTRAFRRLTGVLRFGAVAGVAVGVVRVLRGRRVPEVTGHASWPPLIEAEAPDPRAGPVQFDADWVEPIDGVCPGTHPVKGNRDSGIFHVPGGTSYERTVPERCYATEADAESDGFRKAKR